MPRTQSIPSIHAFNLDTPEGRTAARAAGHTVPRSKPAPKVEPAATVVEPIRLDDAHCDTKEESIDSLAAKAQAGLDRWMKALNVASPTRYIVGGILALAAACGLGWIIGNVLSWLMIAVALATGSMFLVYAVFIVGLIASLYAGYKLSGFVFDYVVTKKVDAHYDKCKSIVTGFFGRKPAPVVAATPA